MAQQIMRHHVLPVARKLGINKRIGWHTFRHTYSTLLRSTGAELKTMQELLRHSTIRVTRSRWRSVVRKRQLSRSCSRKKHRTDEERRRLGLEPVPVLCLFVPTRKRKASDKSLNLNGGDDGTRTRGRCQNRQTRHGSPPSHSDDTFASRQICPKHSRSP